MTKKIFITFFIFFFLNSAFAMNDGPRFVILPNVKTNYLMRTNAQHGLVLQNKVINFVKETLHITAKSPYTTIRIRIIYNDHFQISALIVYLLSNEYKNFEVVRINLNPNYTISSIIRNYQLKPEDYAQSPAYLYKEKLNCPDEKVQFVIGNNFGGDESVEKVVHKIYRLARDKGYNPFLMDVNHPNGPQPTVKAYQEWLSCPNIKGFYNESHGSNVGILLSDDDLTYQLIERDLVNKLIHHVVLFDSCQTFNDPLLASIVDATKGNVQQYIAGKINLPFGPSERTAACIWRNAFSQQLLNEEMISICAKKNGLKQKAFQIAGNGENYLLKPT